jgi:hypothetical protein
VALALLLFVYLPWQVYELYRHSQLQATVIDAIADGDPDIRQILDLVHVDPSTDWLGDQVGEAEEPSIDFSALNDEGLPLAYEEIEVLTYSRIIDLRRWRPYQPRGKQGNVYVRDRFTLKLLDDKRDRVVTLMLPVPTDDIEFRQENSQVRANITRITKPYEEYGDRRTLYELEYDLSRIPVGESTTLELEGLLRTREPSARAPFVCRTKTDLISVWMLFPADFPYRTYSLVRYPLDRSAPPELMNSRYSIDHPYGSLIGWSVVNPQVGMVYECRWIAE